MKPLTLILLFLVICNFLIAGGNDDKNKMKYKITAVKKGETAVISESNISEINLPLAIYIPKAFTPNGDGLNDSFGIAGEGISEFNISIFNKWGEMIFESKSLDDQWNGMYGGVVVQDGAYVYHIDIRTTDKKSVVKSGTVTVLK
jgi:gliding motility-associated-like protein